MIHTRNGGQGLLQRLLAMFVIAFAVLQPASAQTVNATLRGQTGLPGGEGVGTAPLLSSIAIWKAIPN